MLMLFISWANKKRDLEVALCVLFIFSAADLR